MVSSAFFASCFKPLRRITLTTRRRLSFNNRFGRGFNSPRLHQKYREPPSGGFRVSGGGGTKRLRVSCGELNGGAMRESASAASRGRERLANCKNPEQCA